jgi:hypothetical protein
MRQGDLNCKISSLLLLATLLHKSFGSDVLSSGSCLAANARITTTNLQNTLIMQPDKNLVLYTNVAFSNARWATDTFNRQGSGFEACMQDDGNLVIKDDKNNLVWASGTAGHTGAYAHVY